MELSALVSGLLKDRSLTTLRSLDAAAVTAFEPAFERLADELRREFIAEGVDASAFTAERQVDARYAGQSHDLTIAIPPNAGENRRTAKSSSVTPNRARSSCGR